MATPWIDSADVSAYMGRDLTDVEGAQVDVAIDVACLAVEHYTGRSWRVAAVVDEPVTILAGSIYLGRPITAVSSVKTRSPYVGSPTTTVPASQWSVWSLANGRVLVSSYAAGDALISYTPATTVPADVQLATAMLAAGLLAPTGSPELQGDIKSYSVGTELTVVYRDTPTAAPPKVVALLAPYRRMVFA